MLRSILSACGCLNWDGGESPAKEHLRLFKRNELPIRNGKWIALRTQAKSGKRK